MKMMSNKEMMEEEMKTQAEEAQTAATEEKQSSETPEDTEACAGKAGDDSSQGAENAENAEGAEADSAEGSEAEAETDPTAEAEAAESERYLRLLAEFQNFKKRAVKEKSDIHAYANEKIMGELLPVLDNFERAFETDVAADPEAYVQGMQMIFQQMKDALEKSGLKEIGALGEDFDPNKHSAVMMETSGEYEAGKICKVFQKGYTLNDKVVRPAMVVVSQ